MQKRATEGKGLFQLGRYWIGTVPGSSRYYAFWYEPGLGAVRRRSLKTAGLEDAKIELAAIVLTDAEAEARGPEDVPLIAVLDRYWREHSDHRPNPSAARRAGDLLLDFLGDDAAKVAVLTKPKQREFIRHLHGERGLSVAYISRVQSIVAAALNRACAEDDEEAEGAMLTRAPRIIVPPSAIAEILDAAEPEPDNWHPTLQQIAAFFDAVAPEETTRVGRQALLTLTFAGRPEAVRDLGSAQFDPRHGLLRFNAPGRRQTKKYRPTLPVPGILAPHLKRWRAEADWLVHKDGAQVKVLRKPWGKTLERAGLPPEFAPKALRHFMATEMRKRGVPREQREEWMGHRRHSTGDRYGQFAPDYLSAAKQAAEAVLRELQAACEKPLFSQVTLKSAPGSHVAAGLKRFDPIGKNMVGATGIEPVTPTMSTLRNGKKSA